MTYPVRKPFLPSDRTRTDTPIFRAATALLLNKLGHQRYDEVMKNWPGDEKTEWLVTRSAVLVGNTTTPGWASELAGRGVSDIVNVMAPVSAGFAVLQRGLQFKFDGGYKSISVPGLLAAKTDASFVTQGVAIPVRKFDVSKFVSLDARKLATLNVVSDDLLQHSTPNIELAVKALVTEGIGLAAEDKMFDATAGDTTRPPGLLNGISATSASANAVKLEAMKEDAAALISGVSAVAGNAPILFVAAPAQAAALRLWGNSTFAYEVFASSALTAGVVIAIAANCLVSAADPLPRFEVTEEAVVVMDDSPTDIVTGGTAFAGAVKSLFQTNTWGLRTILQISWGLRSTSGLAWTQSVSW
jgi:hypothetical protein